MVQKFMNWLMGNLITIRIPRTILILILFIVLIAYADFALIGERTFISYVAIVLYEAMLVIMGFVLCVLYNKVRRKYERPPLH